jgi:DNA-binding transcriptional regulator YbjK
LELPAEFEFAFVEGAAHSFAMSHRQLILEAVQQMPERASADEVVEELLRLSEVKKRLAKSDRGAVGVSQEDAVEMPDSWIIK